MLAHQNQMKTTILTDWQQLSSLEADWNALLNSSRSDCIFLTWEWVQAWRAVVGESQDLLVIAVRDKDDKLVGVAPFYRYRLRLFNRITFKALRILADYSTGFEYGDWFVHPDCEQAALNAITSALLASHKQWDVIWMPRMSGWNGALDRLSTVLEHAGMFYRSRSSTFSSFDLPDDITDFEAGFSTKRRQQLRRNKRKLISVPGVEIEHCRDSEQLPEFIEQLFNLHHQRRLLLDDPGCFIRRPAEAAFYRQFLPKALAQGWLRFAALKQDGKIEAIQIGYAYNHEFLQMQEGFNPDYVNGAGNVLRHIVIEECIAEGLKKYDFLGGFTEHKRRWGAQERYGHDLLIAHPSLKNRLLFMREIWPSGRYIREFGLFDGN